jgi:AcrR family transcriptional regulator
VNQFCESVMTETTSEVDRRLREALLDLCVERGYADLRLENLLERAGVDATEFHRGYAALDACFNAVLAQAYGEFFELAQAALAGQVGWRDRMRATAYALLRFLRADERVARLAAVEAQHGGKGRYGSSSRPSTGWST